MFLRSKDGFYAGQVREFSPQAGKALLESGRAVNPFNEIEDAAEERAVVTAKPAKRSSHPRGGASAARTGGA